jgi:hypothetical protein
MPERVYTVDGHPIELISAFDIADEYTDSWRLRARPEIRMARCRLGV